MPSGGSQTTASMPSLHSILGGSRIKKKSSSTKRSSSSSSSPSFSSSSSAPPSWMSSLARTKPGATTPKSHSNLKPHSDNQNHGQGRLGDLGPAIFVPRFITTPATSSSLSSRAAEPRPGALQLHQLILHSMFDSHGTGAGLSSSRIASALQFRAALPPLVSAPHLRGVLLAAGAVATPAAAERELAALVRAGRVRRVVVPLRGMVGELVVLSTELEGMVMRAAECGGGLRERFASWLRGNPGRLSMGIGPEEGSGEEGFEGREVDALVRAGLLTALQDGGGGGGGGGEGGGRGGLYARPEKRYAMISLEAVARAPAGSVAAVGGEGAVHAAGGTGARSMVGPTAGSGSGMTAGGFSVAVPGAGVFLKLVQAAVEHLVELLRRSRYREMPESDLREKWDGGVVGDNKVALAKKARGEFTGVMPGRTKKWREFHGLAFDWVLQEAVGAGLVEVFESRGVGRGVRLV